MLNPSNSASNAGNLDTEVVDGRSLKPSGEHILHLLINSGTTAKQLAA